MTPKQIFDRAVTIVRGVNAAYVDSVTRGTPVPRELIMAVILTESTFRPGVTSSVGARGLMQVMPGTGKQYGVANPDDLYDIATNIMAGTRYLGDLKKQFGNWDAALAAYNQGPGSFARHGPYAETLTYVGNVLSNWERFNACCFWP